MNNYRAVISSFSNGGTPAVQASIGYTNGSGVYDPEPLYVPIDWTMTLTQIRANVVIQAQNYATANGYTITDFQFLSDDVHTVNSATRSLNSAFQISTMHEADVVYSVDISATLSLTTGQSGTVILETATNSGFTTGVQTLSRFTNGNSGTLAIGLGLTQIGTAVLSGKVPAGNYVRLRTVNNTGTPTYTYQSGIESY